jgi:hypothetical protein
MNISNLSLNAFLLILAGFLFSCTDDKSVDNLIENPVENPNVIIEDIPFDTPVKISIEYYSLYGTMCNWNNRNNEGEVIVINSDEEMRKYLTCHMGTYHPIDFSKHSLLLVNSVASSGIYSISPEGMQQISSNKYVLDITLILNEITEPLEWDIKIRTDKLTNNASVELKVDELPADLTSIMGKWKLMKGSIFDMHTNSELEFDYSQHHIVYEFQTNGVLKVSGDANLELQYPTLGEHTYSIGNYKEILISSLHFWYQVSSTVLIIDGRPLDGPVFYFSKIE